MKPTLVLGASPHPYRYAYLAATRLNEAGHPVQALGRHSGHIGPVPIQIDRDGLDLSELDTITVYLRPDNQEEYRNWILDLKPRRVIFNPGAENPAFARELQAAGVEAVEACTLVLLSTRQY